MKRGSLSQHFSGIASKRLSSVEVAGTSNQHEFNGSRPVIDLLGAPGSKVQLPARFLYLDDSGETRESEGHLTWYDARVNQPHRNAEGRLYYRTNAAMENARANDLLVLGRLQNGELLALIVKADTSAEAQVSWLFGIDEATGSFRHLGESDFDRKALEFASRTILETLGIESIEEDEAELGRMLEQFGGRFPTTRLFSEYARRTYGAVEVTVQQSDDILLAWYEREERLFLLLERHLVQDRLKAGFSEVEEFMEFSLSVQNRRKARAGSALENHIQAVLVALDIRHSRGQVTEGTARPDFIFPGVESYRDPAFPERRLTMLGAKSTCKDRWRQILPEAKRIANKHLLTLEPAISVAQTSEMRAENVSLVIPKKLHVTYKQEQAGCLMTVGRFLSLTRDRQ